MIASPPPGVPPDPAGWRRTTAQVCLFLAGGLLGGLVTVTCLAAAGIFVVGLAFCDTCSGGVPWRNILGGTVELTFTFLANPWWMVLGTDAVLAVAALAIWPWGSPRPAPRAVGQP